MILDLKNIQLALCNVQSVMCHIILWFLGQGKILTSFRKYNIQFSKWDFKNFLAIEPEEKIWLTVYVIYSNKIKLLPFVIFIHKI